MSAPATVPRSTKAGARTPATPRQPEPRSWRHRARSTKAGARTPATRDLVSAPLHQLHRSTKAGARTPATPDEPLDISHLSPPLNEGRGANPGDTRRTRLTRTTTALAQRRPGREPRRHCCNLFIYAVTSLRSTKAGARTPATPLLGHDDAVRVDRSTKAGARTPATPASCATRRRSPGSSLNEGRGANPGDTPRRRRAGQRRRPRSTKAGARTPATRAAAGDAAGRPCRAQRRPGREPRRHRPSVSSSWRSRPAQRRPGREPRRHLRLDAGAETDHGRSTKAGARTPATPGESDR